MQIWANLFLVGSGRSGVGLTHPLDCNVFLVDGGRKLALIDAGVGLDTHLIEQQIAGHGRRLGSDSLLLLTHGHADHSGGTRFLRERYSLQVAGSPEEAIALRAADEEALGLNVARAAGYYPADYRLRSTPVDRELSDGEEIDLGDVSIRVTRTPGHSSGGLSFLCEIDGRRTLFVGDLLAFGGYISLQNIPGVDVLQYGRSVLKLEGLEIEMFMPGHGLFTVSGGQYHIDKAAASFRKLGVPPNAI